MSKFLKALGNFFRAQDEQAAESISDVSRDSRFAIEDSKKDIAVYESKIAKLMAETNILKGKLATAQTNVEKFDKLAKKAAAAGIEADVKTAVQEKNNSQTIVNTMTAEIVKNEQITANLRAQLATARSKVASAESNLTRLSAQLEGSKIRKELAKSSTEFNAGDSPLSKLNDLEKAVNAETAEAEAWETLAGDAKPAASLEEKYGDGKVQVDDEVARLLAEAKK